MSFTPSEIAIVEIGLQGPAGTGLTAGEKTAITDDIATLQSDLAAAEADLATAMADIATLQGQIATIEDGLWLGLEFDGGGSTLGTGVRRRILIPYDCTIVADPVDSHAWRVGLDQSGSISLDLWMDTYGNYPPTNADRISGSVGSQNPRITTATKAASGTLTGWTTALVGGRYLFAEIVSVTSATYANLGLYVERSL